MTDIEATLRQVESALHSPEFKARLMAVMARHGLYRPRRSALLKYRVETAAKIMASGQRRAEVRDAMQARFQVSRRTAYRLISRALDNRQRSLFGD